MFRLVSLALAAAAGLALLVAPAPAAPITIGTKAPEFNGLEATDGKSYSSADFKDKDVLVICITCNHCPVAMAYEDRIIDFAKKHAGKGSKVGFIAINVNPGEEDGLPRMKERVKDKGMTYVYAIDPSQKIATQLGATRTPEFFVFNKERKLVYTGALDDSMNAEKVKEHYLVDAVKATLKGETPTVPTSAPVGCGIQYQKGSR
jgi:peroxiredoxin